MNEYPRTVPELRDQLHNEAVCRAYFAKLIAVDPDGSDYNGGLIYMSVAAPVPLMEPPAILGTTNQWFQPPS
jgi:hypothetical protein